MIYLETHSHSPSYNLAFEEYAFRQIAEREKDDIFILWRNQPCIVVGKNQNIIEEINLKYCKEKQLPVVRRMSGGGTVYHDLQNLNFTFILNAEKSSDFNLKVLGEPILKSLHQLGIPAELTPRNDLFVEGKKVCGTAQHMLKNRLLYHGCLLFSADLEVLKEALKVKTLKVSSRSTKSVRSEVTNLKNYIQEESFGIEAFTKAIHQGVQTYFGLPAFKRYELTEEDQSNILQLEKERNLSWDWTFGKNPSFTLEKELVFSGQSFLLEIKVEAHQIENIQIPHFEGALLPLEDKQLLQSFCDFLKGSAYQEEVLKEKVEAFRQVSTSTTLFDENDVLQILLP